MSIFLKTVMSEIKINGDLEEQAENIIQTFLTDKKKSSSMWRKLKQHVNTNYKSLPICATCLEKDGIYIKQFCNYMIICIRDDSEPLQGNNITYNYYIFDNGIELYEELYKNIDKVDLKELATNIINTNQISISKQDIINVTNEMSYNELRF